MEPILVHEIPSSSAGGNAGTGRRGARFEQHLVSAITVGRPLEEVFAFFSDASNLEHITPPELGFSIVTPPPIPMREGTLIDYRLSIWGVRFRWRTLISRWDPPHAFVDEQLVGPYAQWIHEHRFHATPSGTRIEDEVRYRLPLGLLGLAGLPIVRRQVERIFAFRSAVIASRFGKKVLN